MKKIRYPQCGTEEYAALLNEYKDIFKSNIMNMEKNWCEWKQKHLVVNIPESVEDLLVADANVLADVYNRFVTLELPENVKESRSGRKSRSSYYRSLDNIFDYRRYGGNIADFFINKAEMLHISACHYCELSYINVYTKADKERRQFDLDHFFPKSKCPILALSLFNFIPSCQICNSRIKMNRLLGEDVCEWEEFNPASVHYDFDANVSIRLRMKRPVTDFRNSENYYIHFRCINQRYRKPVVFFHLEERYNFHRIEAMRLMCLKAKYPKSAIRKLSGLLHKSEADITEDIFHRKYLAAHDRCFAKMTRDVLR